MITSYIHNNEVDFFYKYIAGINIKKIGYLFYIYKLTLS